MTDLRAFKHCYEAESWDIDEDSNFTFLVDLGFNLKLQTPKGQHALLGELSSKERGIINSLLFSSEEIWVSSIIKDGKYIYDITYMIDDYWYNLSSHKKVKEQ